MEKQQAHPVMDVVNQGVEELKSVLEQNGLSPEEPAISDLLDNHFLKMEKLLTEFTEKMEKASLKEIPQLEMNIVGKLKRLFTDLTDGLKQIVVDTKEQVRTGIENKVNDIKIDIHNKIASKVQGVNDKIKKFADTLDAKYSIIEKTGNTEQVQEEKKPINIEAAQPAELEFTFSKEHVKQVLFPYIEELKGKYEYLSTEVVKEIDRGDEFTLSLRENEYTESYHTLTVDLNTGIGELKHHFIDSENESWFNNSTVDERFNVEDLGINELEQESPEIKLTPSSVKEVLLPYIQDLKERQYFPYAEISNEELKDDNQLYLALKQDDLEDSLYQFKVDLNTGEGTLDTYWTVHGGEYNEPVSHDVLKKFNVNDLIDKTLEQQTTSVNSRNSSEEDLKLNNKTQVSPALKTAPEALNESKHEENKAPNDSTMKQLKNENDGLKTFLHIVKSKHPEVYQSVYNDIKNGLKHVPKAAPKIEVKPKEKVLELQL